MAQRGFAGERSIAGHHSSLVGTTGDHDEAGARTIPAESDAGRIVLGETRWVCAGNAKSFPFAGGIFSVTVSHVSGRASVNAHRVRGVFVE